jgi:hypothetical protein
MVSFSGAILISVTVFLKLKKEYKESYNLNIWVGLFNSIQFYSESI